MPLPRAVRTLLADFTGLRVAGEAVSPSSPPDRARRARDDGSVLYQRRRGPVYAAGYPRDAAAVLLVESMAVTRTLLSRRPRWS